MGTKSSFYVALYEQLALQGFQAYVSCTPQNYIADICVKGNNIAHLTKLDTIKSNPHSGVDDATMDTLQKILRDTKQNHELYSNEKNLFSVDEMATVHANLSRLRILPNNDLSHEETVELDRIVEKLEDVMPELVCDASFANSLQNDMCEGAEL